MPAWTLGDLMSQATTRIGRRDDVPQSDVSLWVNQAYVDVAERAHHKLLESTGVMSTSSGSDIVGVPADFNEPVSVSLATDNAGSAKTLRQISIRQWDAIQAEEQDLGVPEQYAFYNDCLYLNPSPDSAYSLEMRYKSFNSTLVATTDVPSLTTGWRFPVLLKAEEYLLQYVNDFEGAAAKRNEFLSTINSLDDDRGKRQKDESPMGVHVVYARKPKRD